MIVLINTKDNCLNLDMGFLTYSFRTPSVTVVKPHFEKNIQSGAREI